LNDGWHSWYYNGEEEVVGMNHTFFVYMVKFDKLIADTDAEIDDQIKDLTVVQVTYEGIGDAATQDITGIDY